MNAEMLYVGGVLLASGFVIAVSAWVWSKDLDISGQLFVLTVAIHPLVGVFVAAELLAPTRELAVLMYTIHTGLGSAIPVAFALFAISFATNRRVVSRRLLASAAVYVAVVFGLEVTNPIHGVARTGYEVVGTTIPHLSGAPTSFFTVLTMPVFIGYYAAIGILGYRFLARREGRWTQTVVLFVGFIPPFAVTALWLGGVLVGPLNGAFVIGSGWMASFAGWAVLRHQLFDVVPLAREAAFDALDERVIVVDDEHRLLDYNETAATTFPELVSGRGESLESVLPTLVADAETRPDGGTATDDHPFVSTFTRDDDGTPREYTLTVSTLQAGGAVRGYVLLIRDITDRQRHVRDLEQQTAQLERFASTLSHDLRNPLNVAYGRIELARMGGEESDLETALDALDRAERIIEDLLTLAREGRTIDDRQRVSLVDVAESAWRTTDTGDATLTLDIAPTIAVYADRTRLQNVFENLFRNSVEHGSTDSSASLTVTLGRHDDGFYVEDDGVGIPPEHREHVFDDEYTTGGGTGLGLTIVDAIAQAHGWTTGIETGRDGGTRIVFGDVTLADDAADDEHRSVARVEASSVDADP
ncbi:PAS fold-containing protein [Haloplanus vescus]|uniref:histidine kinase n=2 Tax=Haloplanus vescus TaxID=555874 RepID=A0A1H3VNT6_9EURY|nr:PAS fold-containing protein [Haloplanus vescus]